jgi:hypothetical protein
VRGALAAVASQSVHPIKVHASVADYRANAMFDRLQDGRVVSYDASILKVLNPDEVRREALTIYHSEPAPADSPWRAIGGELTFTLDPDLLKDDVLLFDGAPQDVRLERPR